jgi:alpha-ketoglutarate-dependent taurine dioxygenase
MLFHALYDPQAGMYLEHKAFTLHGELDAPAFLRAWERVVERHPILRTAFVWQGLEEPLQVVRQRVKLLWRQDDWRALAPAAQQAQLQAFLSEDRAQGLNPAKAPLLRLALFRLADKVHQFVWTHHHLLVDGWSLPILFRDVFTCYEAFRQGAEPQLAQSRPYRDYIAWLQQRDMAQAEAFWRNELQGFAAPTPLPGGGQAGRPTHPGIYGEQHLGLSEAETAALQALAAQQQLTMNTLVQGAWGLLLSYHSGAKDVVFGATVSGRPAELAGVETMVGVFINTLPVRLRIAEQTPLLTWLRELQTRQVEARQYEYSPLTAVQGWSAVPRGRPLFEHILVYENYPVKIAAPEQQASLEVRNFRGQEHGNYPLIVKGALSTRLGLGTLHDGRLFTDAAITGLLNQWKTLLNSMAAQPSAQLGELSNILRETERKERLMEQRKRQELDLASFMNVKPQAVSVAPREPRALTRSSYLQPGHTLPLVLEPALADVDLADWAGGAREFIETELFKHGAILFRGFGVETIAQFEQFAAALRPDLYGEYGDLPRESGKVYKSTPYPEDKTILFHNESSHMHRWPMKQWFYCVHPAQKGGETPLVDCRQIYQRLPPRIVENFQRKKLRYMRNFHEGLDVSWQEFFRTTDKAAVERYCQANSIAFEWPKKGGLRTWQISPGVARHPKTGEMVFFNQVQLHHVFFLDPELRRSLEALFSPDEYPRNVSYGDGSPIEDAVMDEILRVYWENASRFLWRRGDIVLLDNMLVAHARNPYQGERKITVAMAEMMALNELL